MALATYKEWSAYRTHSLVSVFVGPVYFAVQYFIWTAVYGGSNSLNGMALQDMIRYFGASALIGYLVMDFADWNLSMLVHTGKFLTFSLRPLHHRFFALAQKIGHRILGFFFEFLPCLVIFVFVFQIDMMPVYPFYTLLSVLLAFFMTFYVHYCLGLLSFWFVQSSGIRSVFNLVADIFSGTLIPLVFFPGWMQFVQFFLPFQYMNYVPAMIFNGSYTLGGVTMEIPVILCIQFCAVIVAFLISEILYRCSVRRFTGVGA
mgnify:FL=1